MKAATILLLVFAAVPLLIYPFVLLANVMSLAGTRTGSEPVGQVLVSYAFLFASTAYPLAYLLCLIFSIVAMKTGREQAGLYWSLGPFVYLLGLGLLFVLWMLVG
jgi:hypothetical protein